MESIIINKRFINKWKRLTCDKINHTKKRKVFFLKNKNLKNQIKKIEDDHRKQVVKLLNEDEEIKWYRRRRINLLFFFNAIILFILTTVLVGIIGVVLFGIFNSPELMIMIGTFLSLIILDIFLISIALYKRHRRKTQMNMTYRELKYYNEIVMITIRRFIYKSYYYSEHNISNLYDDDVLHQINDIILLGLNFVDYLVINKLFKKIYIFVGSQDDYPDFYIDFTNDKENDIESVFTILKDLIPLELIESTKHAKKYKRIKKLE